MPRIMITLHFMFALAAATAIFQLTCALLYWRQLKREFSAPEPGPLPATTVLIPCKGDSECLARNARSVLAQAYPGRLDFIFIVPSRCDPAYARLQSVISEFGGGRARLLVSDAQPTRCSEKILNLLHGLRHLAADTEVLLFADADILVAPDWAKWLVEALNDRSVGLATTVMLCIPANRSLWALLRMLWVVQGLPFYRLMAAADGQSMTVRRRDFERWGVAGLWKRCVSEDAALDKAVRSAGAKVRYIARLLPISVESCYCRDMVWVFNRWFVYARVYDPVLWVMMALTILGKTWILFWAIRSSAWSLFGLALSGDAALMWVVLSILRRFHGDRFLDIAPVFRSYRFWGALAAPLVLPVYLVNLANSLVTRDIRWGGYTYRLHGPFNVEVLGRQEAGLRRPIVSPDPGPGA